MTYSILIDIALYIPLLPALLTLVRWNRLQRVHKWFAALIWYIVIISISGEVWHKMTGKNNMPFFHLYILIEYLMMIQIFRILFGGSMRHIVWNFLMGVFLIIWLINVFAGEGWWGFPDYIHALEAIIILSILIKWFMKMFRERKIQHPEKTFEFWFCAGLLIFFSGNLLLFMFPKFLIDAGNEVFDAIWKVNCLLIILLYLMYTVALLWVRKTAK